MTKHLEESKHWQITTHVLEGDSFSQVARRFNISKAGAAKIFKKMKFKVFPLSYEREQLNLNMSDINSLRQGWREIKPF